MEASDQIKVFESRYCLRREMVEAIRPFCVSQRINKGESVLEVGDTISDFIFLVKGAIKQIRYTDEGTEIVNALYFCPGDPILPIEHDLFCPAVSKTDMVALRQSEIIRIECKKAVDLMRKVEGVSEQIAALLNEVRQWYSNFQFTMSAYRSNLKGLLIHLMKSDPYIMANAGLEDLASLVGVSYYHLSRVKNEIKREYPELIKDLEAYKT